MVAQPRMEVDVEVFKYDTSSLLQIKLLACLHDMMEMSSLFLKCEVTTIRDSITLAVQT